MKGWCYGVKLRVLGYLSDIEEYDGVSISAKLRCTCGSSEFEFSHTGKQTKGILAPYIIRKNGQLRLKASCHCCGNSLVVYDSTEISTNTGKKSLPVEFVPFAAKSLPNKLSVVIKYNYRPEKLKIEDTYSNHFENCFIYIMDKQGQEGKALIEE